MMVEARHATMADTSHARRRGVLTGAAVKRSPDGRRQLCRVHAGDAEQPQRTVDQGVHAAANRPDPTEYRQQAAKRPYPYAQQRHDRSRPEHRSADGVDRPELRLRERLADHSDLVPRRLLPR